MTTLRTYLVLCKAPVSCFAACSAVSTCLLAPSPDRLITAFLAAGVLLLAAGASALNQFQERDIDALMDRTRHRPLPAGVLKPQTALIVALVLIASGMIVLLCISAVVTLLGAFAVLWYNCIYTPLKRRSAFAAIPGALVGIVPPVMGWTAGNGEWTDPKLFAVSMLFFLWQVPHFWLLLLQDNDSYSRAGLPVLTDTLPGKRLAGIAVLWTACAASASLALPLYGVVLSPAVSIILPVIAVSTSMSGLVMLRRGPDPAAAHIAFRSVNLFLACIILLLSIDPFLRRS